MRRSAICVGLIVAALAHDAAFAELVLEKAVLISRHGVRAPTSPDPPLSDLASRPWPAWPVGTAHLTPRGKTLASLMGAYYRKHFAARGLLPAKACPAPDEVYVWADIDQRTLQTGEGLLAGMFPDCDLTIHNAPTDKPDPIFHPVRAGACSIDGERGRAAVLERAGGDLEKVLKVHRKPLRKLQAVLDCCAPKLCPDSHAGRCTLEAVPSTVDVRHKDGGVRISGPISIGSTVSEVFLLQYAQGMPRDRVAWGRAASPASINELLRLHQLQFDLIERAPYLAARQGSALLQRILEALRPATDGASGVPVGSKLVVYVGHDTNLANIGGMLGLHWDLKGYLRDETPPAGALAFELLRDPASNRHFVRMTYYAQTFEQLRRMTRLDLAHPPAQARIVLSGCADGPDRACAWPDFAARVTQALDQDCVIKSQ